MTYHTQGPWVALEQEDDKDYIRVRGTIIGSLFKIANVPAQNWKEEAKANAKLIAAAPEMLQALEYFIDCASKAHSHWDNDNDTKVGKYLLAMAGLAKGYDKKIDAIHELIAKTKGVNHDNN